MKEGELNELVFIQEYHPKHEGIRKSTARAYEVRFSEKWREGVI